MIANLNLVNGVQTVKVPNAYGSKFYVSFETVIEPSAGNITLE